MRWTFPIAELALSEKSERRNDLRGSRQVIRKQAHASETVP